MWVILSWQPRICGLRLLKSSTVVDSRVPTEIEVGILETKLDLVAGLRVFYLKLIQCSSTCPYGEQQTFYQPHSSACGIWPFLFIKMASDLPKLPGKDCAKIINMDGVQLIKPPVVG